MVTSIEKGDTFRDTVASLLEAAGFRTISEVRREFKKVDIEATWNDRFDGPMKLLIEAKDYSSTLSKDECIKFLVEYEALVAGRKDHRAWLISRGAISPDGRELIEAKAGLKCFTYPELQKWTFNLTDYTEELVDQFEREKIGSYFIPPKTANDEDLDKLVDQWIEAEFGQPLAITGSYGIGKTTFAKHLAARLGAKSLSDVTARVPILIPLGEVYNEQSIDGLIGKVFASTYRAHNYHFKLFEKLNAYGRFVLIFDGFDEMKHGMTLRGFEKQVADFLTLDKNKARLIILGRDTAFHTEVEFRSIIEGKRRTIGGAHAEDLSRRAFRPIIIRGFTLAEAHYYIKNYFPVAVDNASRRLGKEFDRSWIESRQSELISGSVDELLDRPVHAQMLCEIATDKDISLDNISRYRLYDQFIHHLIDREVKKKGRSTNFDIYHRRAFNASLAWWLWERGGASTTTFGDIPDELCSKSVDKVPHDYDEIALRRELIAGCLVSKGGETIYFSHRSIQEFLVAEHLLNTNFLREQFDSHQTEQQALLLIANTLTPEVVYFLVSGINNRNVSNEQLNELFVRLTHIGSQIHLPLIALDLFTKLLCASGLGLDPWTSPWSYLIENFTRIGRAEFHISDQELSRATEMFIAATSRDLKTSATAIFYWIRCLRRDSGNANKLTALLLARLISPGALEAALRAIKNRSPGSPSQIVIEYRVQPLLWLFLNVVQIEAPRDSEIRAKLDIRKVISWSVAQCGLNVHDEIVAGVVQSFRSFSYCSLSEICEALVDLRYTAGDASTVRRYFTNSEFQNRLRSSKVRVPGIS